MMDLLQRSRFRFRAFWCKHGINIHLGFKILNLVSALAVLENYPILVIFTNILKQQEKSSYNKN